MAGRKLKEGLDYIPLTTRRDHRLKKIRALHLDIGHIILQTLLEDIHGNKGYFIEWDEDYSKVFALENGFSVENLLAVVKDCLRLKIFSKEKYENHKILTSEEIQLVWIKVAKERKEIIYKHEYLLINIRPYLKENKSKNENEDNGLPLTEEILNYDESIAREINPISPPRNSKNPADNTQVEEGKEETKEEAEEIMQVEEFKERNKESEAFNFKFSHSASDFSQIKNEEEFVKKNNEKSSREKDEINPEVESIRKKYSGSKICGKQEDIPEFRQGSEPKVISNSVKRKHQPHPTRKAIIELWQQKFNQPYSQTLTGNQSINHIIRHLDSMIKMSLDPIPEGEELNSRIEELWDVILSNWSKLDNFYKAQIQFESIAKNLTVIINQLKNYGANKTQSEEFEEDRNGAKPTFDRFRKKNGASY